MFSVGVLASGVRLAGDVIVEVVSPKDPHTGLPGIR